MSIPISMHMSMPAHVNTDRVDTNSSETLYCTMLTDNRRTAVC